MLDIFVFFNPFMLTEYKNKFKKHTFNIVKIDKQYFYA